MVRVSKRPHRAAVTRMLRATGLAHVPEEAPLVELLRSLADEMDSGPGARVRAEYLSALKDVRRVLNSESRQGSSRAGAAPPAPADDDSDVEEPFVPNDLEAFKKQRGMA